MKYKKFYSGDRRRHTYKASILLFYLLLWWWFSPLKYTNKKLVVLGFQWYIYARIYRTLKVNPASELVRLKPWRWFNHILRTPGRHTTRHRQEDAAEDEDPRSIGAVRCWPISDDAEPMIARSGDDWALERAVLMARTRTPPQLSVKVNENKIVCACVTDQGLRGHPVHVDFEHV